MHGAAEALRKAGLLVNEHPGWFTRGRTPGHIRPPGIIVHDDVMRQTVSLAARLGILANGHGELRGGPIANAGVGKEGVWNLVSAGRAYHAGRGWWRGHTDGNGFFGVECAWYPGEDYPDEQVDSLVRGCAALARHFDFPAEMVAHHREWALPRGRKADMHWRGPIREQVGLHMLAQAGVKAAAIPQTPARHAVLTHLEDTVQMIELVTPNLDDQGRGWLPLDGRAGRPKVRWGHLVAALPQGSHPGRDQAYWPATQVGVQQQGEDTLLTVQGGVPGSATVLYLSVAEGR